MRGQMVAAICGPHR